MMSGFSSNVVQYAAWYVFVMIISACCMNAMIVSGRWSLVIVGYWSGIGFDLCCTIAIFVVVFFCFWKPGIRHEAHGIRSYSGWWYLNVVFVVCEK